MADAGAAKTTLAKWWQEGQHLARQPGDTAGLVKTTLAKWWQELPSGRRVAIAVALFVAVLGSVYLVNRSDSTHSPARPTIEATTSNSVEVVLYVEGSAKGADLTISLDGHMSQARDKAVPLNNASAGVSGLHLSSRHGAFVQLSAQNTGPSGDITCRITADGEEIARESSYGGFTIASCNATVP